MNVKRESILHWDNHLHLAFWEQELENGELLYKILNQKEYHYFLENELDQAFEFYFKCMKYLIMR